MILGAAVVVPIRRSDSCDHVSNGALAQLTIAGREDSIYYMFSLYAAHAGRKCSSCLTFFFPRTEGSF
jgi:hypothetical protein